MSCSARSRNRTIPSLGPGFASTLSTVVTVPAITAPGTWYVVAQADAAGAVTETNEANNLGTVLLSVGPDLTVTSLSAPASIAAVARIPTTTMLTLLFTRV